MWVSGMSPPTSVFEDTAVASLSLAIGNVGSETVDPGIDSGMAGEGSVPSTEVEVAVDSAELDVSKTLAVV